MAIAPRPATPPARSESDASVQALIDEVDAEVKAENLKNFLKRYGNVIAGAILLLVLGTAFTSAYINWSKQQQEKETALLIAVMDRDPTAMKDDDLKVVMETLIRLGKDGHGEGIRFAAGISEAAMLEKKGEKDAALQRLDALGKDGSLKPLYRDYALLQKIRTQVDSGDAEKLLHELSPLTANNNPWQISALQLAALLQAKQGHNDEAVASLRRILDNQDTPMAAREEAAQLMRLYKAM